MLENLSCLKLLPSEFKFKWSLTRTWLWIRIKSYADPKHWFMKRKTTQASALEDITSTHLMSILQYVYAYIVYYIGYSGIRYLCENLKLSTGCKSHRCMLIDVWWPVGSTSVVQQPQYIKINYYQLFCQREITRLNLCNSFLKPNFFVFSRTLRCIRGQSKAAAMQLTLNKTGSGKIVTVWLNVGLSSCFSLYFSPLFYRLK